MQVAVVLSSGCNSDSMKPLDIQGHRGARGLLPENSIPAFIYAAELGVTTLELDVVVSADSKLVVSHEPWMSSKICSHPDGTAVAKDEEMKLNLYKMTYEEIKKYDCGKRGNRLFPQQKKLEVFKPLLSEVIDPIEKLSGQKKRKPIHYNIEMKSMPAGDGRYHPAPSDFARLLLQEIKKHRIQKRVIVQSFDVRTLKEMDRLDKKIRLALLADSGGFAAHLTMLGFDPAIYSPNYRMVSMALIKHAHDRNILVIPWTVNDSAEMKKLIDWGVDGIITDYPDLAIAIARSRR